MIGFYPAMRAGNAGGRVFPVAMWANDLAEDIVVGSDSPGSGLGRSVIRLSRAIRFRLARHLVDSLVYAPVLPFNPIDNAFVHPVMTI